MAKHVPSLTRFLSRLRGASQPILAETSDGHCVVVKFRSEPEGTHLLFNEAMGTELYAAAGLPVPGWMPVLASEAFLEANPGCWPVECGEAVPPPPGSVFAARYIEASSGRVSQILSGTCVSRVEGREDFWLAWLLDVCAQHTDHRQALFVEKDDRSLRPVYIDHGQMFGGASGELEPRFRASRFLDSRLYTEPNALLKEYLLARVESIPLEQLRVCAAKLPEEWKTPLAISRLHSCLDRLAKRSLLANMLDTLFDDCRKDQDCGRRMPVRAESLQSMLESIEAPSVHPAVDCPELGVRSA